jgi:uncharacterized protein
MDSLIKTLIDDFQQQTLPNLPVSRLNINSLSTEEKIKIFYGTRFCGKTTILFQIISSLLDQGWEQENIFYLDFEDARFFENTPELTKLIINRLFELYPQLEKQKCALFLDEAAMPESWKNILEPKKTSQLHVFLASSASGILKTRNSFSEEKIQISEISPLSFKESLVLANLPADTNSPGPRLSARLENRFAFYLENGGFPDVQDCPDNYRIKKIQEYINTILFKETIVNQKVSRIAPIQYMLKNIIENPGSGFSINKFYKTLKLNKIPCKKDYLYNYLSLLQSANLIYPVYLHTNSEKARKVNPARIYIADTGLTKSFSKPITSDYYFLLTNFVFLQLRRQKKNIEYYRTKNQGEVDFLATSPQTNEIELFHIEEVKRQDRAKSSITAKLRQAAKELQLKKVIIITQKTSEIIKENDLTLEFIPAWQWSLGSNQK